MKFSRKVITQCIGASLLSMLLVPVAHADAIRYGVTCINNNTQRSINYSVKWGDGNWAHYSVGANSSRWHSWAYQQGQRSSPPLTIRFDSDMTDRDNWLEYALERTQAVEEKCSAGTQYQFVWDNGSTRYIDLRRGSGR